MAGVGDGWVLPCKGLMGKDQRNKGVVSRRWSMASPHHIFLKRMLPPLLQSRALVIRLVGRLMNPHVSTHSPLLQSLSSSLELATINDLVIKRFLKETTRETL